jgi:hypothetical protein
MATEKNEVSMPSMKLTVRLSFASGEELVSSAEMPSVSADSSPENPGAPYMFGGATVPDEPVLLSSANFIRIS